MFNNYWLHLLYIIGLSSHLIIIYLFSYIIIYLFSYRHMKFAIKAYNDFYIIRNSSITNS